MTFSYFEVLNNRYDVDLQISDQGEKLLMRINGTNIFLQAKINK